MLGHILSLNFWHKFWWIYNGEKYIINYSVYLSTLFHRLFISGNVQYFFTQIFVQINIWKFSFYKSKFWMAKPENSDIQHRNKDVFISPEMSMTFYKCHRHFRAKFCWNKDTIGHIDRCWGRHFNQLPCRIFLMCVKILLCLVFEVHLLTRLGSGQWMADLFVNSCCSS